MLWLIDPDPQVKLMISSLREKLPVILVSLPLGTLISFDEVCKEKKPKIIQEDNNSTV